MKNSVLKKKLSLKKKTITNLNKDALNRIQGGITSTESPWMCPDPTWFDSCHCTKDYMNTCGDSCDYTCHCDTWCSDCYTQRLC